MEVQTESMESSNPLFDSEIQLKQEENVSTVTEMQAKLPGVSTKRNSLKKYALIAVGCVACTAIGFVAGFATQNARDDGSPTAAEINSREQVLQQMVYETPMLGNLSAVMLNEIVDDYFKTGSWNENVIPSEFVEELAAFRSAFGEDDGTRRLRKLDRSFDTAFVAQAFQEMDVPSESNNFPDPIISGRDLMSVYASNKLNSRECWIIAQGTNEASDWINNAKFGKTEILSSVEKEVQEESCGCKRMRGWWCAEYNICKTRFPIGEAVDGSVEPWNEMSLTVVAQVKSKCNNADMYYFSGHSRGGSLVAIAAFTLWKDGIIPKERIQIASFGMPRTFSKETSDEVHAQLQHWRMINKRDPVPSVPYGWQGFRHFGTVACLQCGYEETRDAPGFVGLGGVSDHYRESYRPWLT